MGLEYYGFNEKPYDPLRPDGLAEGVEEEIRSLSGAEGEISLVSWNGTAHEPRRLVYQTQHFIVVFDSGEEGSEQWNIYYGFP